jgi:hypothetical protein
VVRAGGAAVVFFVEVEAVAVFFVAEVVLEGAFEVVLPLVFCAKPVVTPMPRTIKGISAPNQRVKGLLIAVLYLLDFPSPRINLVREAK